MVFKAIAFMAFVGKKRIEYIAHSRLPAGVPSCHIGAPHGCAGGSPIARRHARMQQLAARLRAKAVK
jgi:hypothetical protein